MKVKLLGGYLAILLVFSIKDMFIFLSLKVTHSFEMILSHTYTLLDFGRLHTTEAG